MIEDEWTGEPAPPEGDAGGEDPAGLSCPAHTAVAKAAATR